MLIEVTKVETCPECGGEYPDGCTHCDRGFVGLKQIADVLTREELEEAALKAIGYERPLLTFFRIAKEEDE